MKLIGAEVRLFRNIVDSSDVAIEPDVTCLVGKNESGKTAFLQALYRLNPARPNAPLNLSQQYPAWRIKQDRAAGPLDDATPVRARFRLETADVDALQQRLGSTGLLSDDVTVSRAYNGRLQVEFKSDERRAVRELLAGIALPHAIAERAAQAPTFGALRDYAQQLRTQPADPETAQAAVTLSACVSEALGNSPNLASAIGEVLSARLPRFFYYSEYSSLPATVKIRELLAAAPDSLSDDLLTARALLTMAGAEETYLLNPDYEVRKRELESVANALTTDALKYWTQNPELRVHIDITQQTASRGGMIDTVLDELRIRIWDERHWLSLPFDDRSSGFRWFFSFLAAFSQYEWLDEPLIILLDEPALGLHARAQKDFLRFITERLAKNGRQVLYTTHSPFMVEADRLERVRIVEDHGRERGAVITRDVVTTDRDTIIPLEGAVGYEVVQHLFTHEQNLLVEDTADYTYVTVLSDFLKDQGDRTFLNPKWSVMPAGGADLIAAFVALLGNDLDLTIVLDRHTNGHRHLTRLADAGYVKQKRMIRVGEILGRPGADLEDLFTVDDYLSLYNRAFWKSHVAASLDATTTPVIDRIARTERIEPFDRTRPAEFLLRHRDEVLPKLSATTLDNFARLFEAVNATFGK